MVRTLLCATVALSMVGGLVYAQNVIEPAPKKGVRVQVGPADVQVVPKEGAVPQRRAAGMIRASQVLGMAIVDAQGETLGTISDVVMDAGTGAAQYVILEQESDEKNFRTMPWAAIAYYQGETIEDSYFVTSINAERLVQSPTIVRSEWPTWTVKQWDAYVPQVNKYYVNVEPATPAAVRKLNRAIRRANP